MSSPVRIAFCGLGVAVLSGCGGVDAASVRAPEQVQLDDAMPVGIEATALDESGAPVPGLQPHIAGVSDPSVLRVGHGNEVQCQKWGRATVTLAAGSARVDVPVVCRLVKELRVAPLRLSTVLQADDSGEPLPRDLGGFQFQAIGDDDRGIPDASIAISTSSEGVLDQLEDGRLRALRPGRGTIIGRIGDQSASLEVEVGLLVTTRKDETVTPSRRLTVPLEPGRYRVSAGADQPVRVVAKGGTCAEHEAAQAVEPVCTLETSGQVRVEAGGSQEARVSLRVVQVP